MHSSSGLLGLLPSSGNPGHRLQARTPGPLPSLAQRAPNPQPRHFFLCQGTQPYSLPGRLGSFSSLKSYRPPASSVLHTLLLTLWSYEPLPPLPLPLPGSMLTLFYFLRPRSNLKVCLTRLPRPEAGSNGGKREGPSQDPRLSTTHPHLPPLSSPLSQ